MPTRKKTKSSEQSTDVRAYSHPEASSQSRADVGTQPNFPKNKLKPSKEYRYDSSLSPALEWDENPAREQAEALIAKILESGSLEDAKAAAKQLKALSSHFCTSAVCIPRGSPRLRSQGE
jgi:adenine-specific DNA-methyltransferase